MTQPKKNIELIIKTLLHEEKIHVETAKSILENLTSFETELAEIFQKGINNYLEKGFSYKKVNIRSISMIEDYNKEECVGETQTDKYLYSFIITRIPKH